MQKSTLAIVIIGAVSIIIGVLAQQSERKPRQIPELKSTIILPSPRALSDVQFTTHNNHTFTRDDLLGRWTILFPGFTNCPDICPTTMQTLKEVKSAMLKANSWGNYRVVMMTVDPKRDSSAQLNKYVPYFDPDFIGITADEETTSSFAKQVGIIFFARDDDAEENYEVDHSASIILINPKAEWAGAISAPHRASDIISDLTSLAEVYADDHQNPAALAQPEAVQIPTDSEQYKDSEPADKVYIGSAWIRPAPETAKSMAGYFSLHNNGADDIHIAAAYSPQFDQVNIHNTRIENGLAKMFAINSLLVPGQSSVVFKPMSLHLMLLGPKAVQAIGSEVEITLVTEEGQKITHLFNVKPQPIE